jgi:GDP-4-dehydro-6-deoxy-D-mannose reductase
MSSGTPRSTRNSDLTSLRAIVTGGCGFSGRALVRRLAVAGIEAHAITRAPPAPDNGPPPENMHVVREVSVAALTKVIEGVRPGWIFHLAGVPPGVPRPLHDAVNAGYAGALLEALKQARRRDCPILFIGSAAEYGIVPPSRIPVRESEAARPVSAYGDAKLAQTKLALAAASRGFRVVVARPFNIIGPGMPPHLALQAFACQVAEIALGRRQPVLDVGNLDTARDFVDVDDAVDAYWALMLAEPWGEIVNICSGHPTAMRELLNRVLRLAGVVPEIRTDPTRLRRHDVAVLYGSSSKFRSITGKAPDTPLDDTLQRVWHHTLKATR